MRRLERQFIEELVWQRFEDGEISCTRDREGRLNLTTLTYSLDESLTGIVSYDINEFHLSIIRTQLLQSKVNSMDELFNLLQEIGVILSHTQDSSDEQ